MFIYWLITFELGIILSTLSARRRDEESSVMPAIVVLLLIAVFVITLTAATEFVTSTSADSTRAESTPESVGKKEDTFLYYPWLQIILAVVTTVITAFVMYYCHHDKKIYTLSQFSKLINKFTKSIADNSTLYLANGDMDFWGKSDNLSNNTEYKTLLRIKRRVKIIKILCRHDIPTGKGLLDKVLHDGITPEDAYGELQKENDSLEQVLKIGKMHADFGTKVDFRFYDTTQCVDRSNIRGRFVQPQDNEKWCYIRSEFKKEIWWWGKLYLCEKKLEDMHRLYEERILNLWSQACEKSSLKVVSFCHRIYCLHTQKKIKNSKFKIKDYLSRFPPFNVIKSYLNISSPDLFTASTTPLKISQNISTHSHKRFALIYA